MLYGNKPNGILKYAKYFIYALSVISFLPYPCKSFAFNVLVIESEAFKAYDYVIEGFQHGCNCRVIKVLSCGDSRCNMKEQIKQSKPHMILAIGDDALLTLKHTHNTPIIYTMVFDAKRLSADQNNIFGINMIIPPLKQLAVFKDLFPSIKRIGIIYNPNNSRNLVSEALDAARTGDIVLIDAKILQSRELPPALNSMAGKIDALWLLPDITVTNYENIEYIMLFSLEHKVPVFTFTDNHLGVGAALSISIDPFKLGLQAGKLSDAVYSGTADNSGNHFFDVDTAKVSLNRLIVKKLSVPFNDRLNGSWSAILNFNNEELTYKPDK
jgi:putative ABC transport system substrate-binding protein